MQERQSREYFERRAQEEREAAENAVDERAAQSHRELAEHYRKIAKGCEGGSAEDVEASSPGILPRDFRILP